MLEKLVQTLFAHFCALVLKLRLYCNVLIAWAAFSWTFSFLVYFHPTMWLDVDSSWRLSSRLHLYHNFCIKYTISHNIGIVQFDNWLLINPSIKDTTSADEIRQIINLFHHLVKNFPHPPKKTLKTYIFVLFVISKAKINNFTYDHWDLFQQFFPHIFFNAIAIKEIDCFIQCLLDLNYF